MRHAHRTAREGRRLRFESIEPRLLLAADWTGLDHVRAAYGLTGQGQTVAVIDTGVAYRHAALGGGLGEGSRVVGGFDFGDGDANPYDDGPQGGHGTHVAGIVASNDASRPGVAPGADVVALRVFDDGGRSSLGTVEQALRWVHEHRNDFRWPITTVTLSLAATWNSSEVPSWGFLEDDLAQLKTDGIFVSVAAGNDFAKSQQPGLSYPAVSPQVVPVAAADAAGVLSSESQRDSRVLVAPGCSILSTVPDYVGNDDGIDNDFARYTGTSMAAPFVAGASMLLREAYQRAGVGAVNEETLYNAMWNTADTIHDPITGRDYRRVNIERAVGSILPKPATPAVSPMQPSGGAKPVAGGKTVIQSKPAVAKPVVAKPKAVPVRAKPKAVPVVRMQRIGAIGRLGRASASLVPVAATSPVRTVAARTASQSPDAAAVDAVLWASARWVR